MTVASTTDSEEIVEGVTLLTEYLGELSYPAVVFHTPSEASKAGRRFDIVFRNRSFQQHTHGDLVAQLEDAIQSGSRSHTEEADHASRSDVPHAARLWTFKRLHRGRIIVADLQTCEVPTNTSPSTKAASSPPVLLPTPSNPTPYSTGGFTDLTSYPPAAMEHNALFLSRPWASTSLGAIETWPVRLRGIVQTMMASPFPVLISYGPDYIQLYNEPYSRVIGLKHPSILGMRYGDAWPEVWGALEPVVVSCYQGNVVHVDCQEMFLLRGERLEETYFSYSMIPLRDADNQTCGLYIPNFDNSVRTITERRIRSLHHISRGINQSLSQDAVIRNALEGMKSSNSRDMHFALFYTAERTDADYQRTRKSARIPLDGSGSRSGSNSRASQVDAVDGPFTEAATNMSISSSTSDSAKSSGGTGRAVRFKLAGSYGVKVQGDDSIPLDFLSVPPPPDDLSIPSREHGLVKLIRQARERDETIHIPDVSSVLPSLSALLNGNPFGDPPGAAVILPIRSSSEDRLHGVMVLGLNTRLEWNEDYSNYIQLVKGLVATGLATMKLHEEDLSRARYLAALNRQKNEELQCLLEEKTKELKTSELKFRSAFAACPAGIWIGSPEGGIWDMNEAYFGMSGQNRNGPLDDWIKHVHPDDVERVQQLFENCKNHTVECEFRFIPTEEEAASGMQEKWVEASGGPVRDETGKVVMLCGALLDITIRRNHLMSQTKRADEALELKRLQDHFIDMLSHELRNPLSAICLSSDGVVESLQMLESRCPAELVAELRDIVNDAGVISLCTVHMRRLVDDVLTLSKLDNNMLVVTPTVSQPEAICRDVMEMVQTEMMLNDIMNRLIIKPGFRDLGVDWVQVDHSRVKQVLINLVANAIKFTTSSPRREITLTLDATYPDPRDGLIIKVPDGSSPPMNRQAINLVFEVIDTGVGMHNDEIQRLFQRFAQGSNRTHLTYGGSGLGLFICRRIMHLLGGEISVRSHVGQGSTFAFYIPVLPESAPPPPISSIPATRASPVGFLEPHSVSKSSIVTPSSSPVRTPEANPLSSPIDAKKPLDATGSDSVSVLLVEDNEISQKLLKKQLLRAGLRVSTANDGVEAIDSVVGSPDGSEFDVILMDIEMPRKGGIEATLEIRAMEKGGSLPARIPIIALSANARSGQIQAMLSAGMDAAISKPFKMSQLLQQIRLLTGKQVSGAPVPSNRVAETAGR